MTKKLEDLRCSSKEQIDKLNETLSMQRQTLYENNMKFESTLEQVNQLKKNIKILEADNLKAQTNRTSWQCRPSVKKFFSKSGLL